MTRGGGDITRATLEEMARLLEQGGSYADWDRAKKHLQQAESNMVLILNSLDEAKQAAPQPFPEMSGALDHCQKVGRLLVRMIDNVYFRRI